MIGYFIIYRLFNYSTIKLVVISIAELSSKFSASSCGPSVVICLFSEDKIVSFQKSALFIDFSDIQSICFFKR